MPTYEFTCPEGHDFEKFYRSIGSAPAEVACPVCGKIAERQLSAGAGLVFKGSGFYITDYGKDGKKDQNAAAAKVSDAKSADGKGGDAKSSESSGVPAASGGESKSESKAGGDSKPSSEPSGGASKPAEAAAPPPKAAPAKSTE